MTPRRLSGDLVRDAPSLSAERPVADALRAMADADLPAVPVLDGTGRLLGIFGEREFIGALFPGYLGEISSAGFIPRSLEDALEKRSSCRSDPVGAYANTEHVRVGIDYSDAQLAEIFLHHRVLVVPVIEDGRVLGIITRRDFSRALADRILDHGHGYPAQSPPPSADA